VTGSALLRLLPFLVSLTFWRKKPRQNASEAPTSASPEIEPPMKESEVARSREVLKVLTLERDIIGTALTTIYESEIQGIITREERDRLLEKYSADLKELESRVSEYQRIVDMFDLLSARKELLRSFQEKLSEIDKKLADLRTGTPPSPSTTEPEKEQTSTPREMAISAQPVPTTKASGLEDAKTKTEKKIEAIREEVLKAMERLEQIESEG